AYRGAAIAIYASCLFRPPGPTKCAMRWLQSAINTEENRCKRRYNDSNRGAIEPGAAPAVERGAEAVDRRGGFCIGRLGLRGGPAHGCRAQPDLSLAPGASHRRGGICGGGGRAGAGRENVSWPAGPGDRARPRHSRAHCRDGAQGLGIRDRQGARGTMIPLPSGVGGWIAAGHSDMRRGMHSLALQVQEVLKRNPHAGDLYVFRGRSGSLIKILWHDGIGMSLYAKRLERGRFIWPSPADGVVAISAGQLAYMLEGIDWRNPVFTWRPIAA